MARNLKPLQVTPDSDLSRILDDAANGPILVERGGVVFQIARRDPASDFRYEPDEEKVHRMLDDVAGSWADLDVDQTIEDVYAARRAGSRPDLRIRSSA